MSKQLLDGRNRYSLMNEQRSTGMSGGVIGYVLLDSGHSGDDGQYLVGFCITP